MKKAREALGDKAPTFGRGPGREGGPRHDGVLGKRRRDAEDASSSDSDVPDDVKRIPMPRDTPPPIPKEILDAWYAKRREKRNANMTNANTEPLGEKNRLGDKGQETPNTDKPIPSKPVSKKVYESAAVIRDLTKESLKAFVPTAVQMKLQKGKGQGGLLEPEEADHLEREGYLKTTGTGGDQEGTSSRPRPVAMEEVEDED